MRCQEFEANVTDLARSGVPNLPNLMDAAIRTEALRHAEACPDCGSLLARHRRLSEALRAVADCSTDQPPAFVEATLLEAFRQKHSAPVSVRRNPLQWLAIAAVLLAAIGAATFLINDREAPRTPETAEKRPAPPMPEPPANPPELAPVEQPENRIAVSHTPAMAKTRRGARRSPDRMTGREITTDFMPIAYGAEYIPIESGQIIRVRMPRSALISYGLPASPDRLDEKVKADILVGNDGLAHAIRFVQ